MIAWLAAAATVVSTPVAIALDRRSPAQARLAKMAAATGFLVVAGAVEAWATSFGRLILVGLALSWIGDLALTYRGTRPFVVGLGAFLLAHGAYTAAFVVRGLSLAAIAIGLVVTAIVGARVLPWLMPHVAGPLRGPVHAYVVAISAMLVAAAGTHGHGAAWRILVGAALFYASDVFVARDRFVAPGPVNRAIGLPLYFGGQLLLAWASGG